MLDYNALINAIPQEWKKWIQEGNVNDDEEENGCVNTYKTKTKTIRQLIQKKCFNEETKPCAYNFWLKRFGIEITSKI